MSEFFRRATLYAELDRALAQQTRFFGAAAMTNSVLHELLSPRLVCLTVPRPTQEFLRALGTHLEGFNLERARLVRHGTLTHTNLDVHMVKNEQTEVQRKLDRLQLKDHANYTLTVSNLDRILSPAGWLVSLGKLLPAATRYRHVLSRVQQKLGHPIRFGSQPDRECIGQCLIEAVRSRHG